MKLLIGITVLSFSLIQISCDQCYGIDCLYDNYDGQVQIIDKTDGSNLVFGSSPKFDKNKIKFFSITGIDTTLYKYTLNGESDLPNDSFLSVHFYPETSNPIFIFLNDNDIDTLNITYKTTITKCCGRITEITNFNYNNTMDVPGNYGTVQFKK